jgi:hypothetical protein
VPNDVALAWLAKLERAADDIEAMCEEWRVDGTHASYRIPHARAVRNIAADLRKFARDWRKDFGEG